MSFEQSYSNSSSHSDFLIHWTGHDFDDNRACILHGPSNTDSTVTAKYLERLRSILQHGLWMRNETKEGRTFIIDGNTIVAPEIPQCCFTELRLSDTLRHAAKFGRLGIGVKRPFVLKRRGRPLSYFGYSNEDHDDPFLAACATIPEQRWLLNYFKPLNSWKHPKDYDLYSESEWRILYHSQASTDPGYFTDPMNKSAPKSAQDFVAGLKKGAEKTPEILIPLDGWLAMIIYPSLEVKNRAQWDNSNGIRGLIKEIKERPDHGNTVEGVKHGAPGNWPIELCLDDCRNF